MPEDDFKENDDIVVLPTDSRVPYAFNLPAASSATANDGAIPFSTNISTVSVLAHNADGTAATGLVAASSVTSNVVTVKLTYPSTGTGTYHLDITCSLDTDSIKAEFNFNRVQVRDR